MEKDQRKDVSKIIRGSTRGLVYALGINLSTLNLDINLRREMPPLMFGEDLNFFTEALKYGGFRNLSKAIEVVHGEEIRNKKGEDSLRGAEDPQLKVYSRVIADLSRTVSDNLSLLDSRAIVDEGTYRGKETRIGELVLTFYEITLRSLVDKSYYYSPQVQRVDTLSEQEGFVLSPMMKKVQSKVR